MPSLPVLRLLLACLLTVTSHAALAQAYPDKSKPIKIIVPFGAGGGTDLMARAVGKAMTEVGGLNTLVDNKPGAETVIGSQAFLASPPDGYTMLFTSSSGITLAPVTIPNLPYDPVKDFVPLVGIGKTPFLMVLGPSTPFKSGREFIAAAKANPGKYSCGSASASTRMACELLQSSAGIKLLLVPYKSAGAATTAVAAGEADTYIADLGSVKALLSAGRVRAIAQTGTTRTPTMAQLPTLREEGAGDYNMAAWFAAYLPAKTPPEVAAALREVLNKAIKTKGVTDMLTASSIEPMDLSGAELTNYARTEIDMWNKLIRTNNIKLN